MPSPRRLPRNGILLFFVRSSAGAVVAAVAGFLATPALTEDTPDSAELDCDEAWVQLESGRSSISSDLLTDTLPVR